MTLTPAFLDELRARTLLSALIGRSIKLTKAGREFKGCCPFHNEKTPSFYVNDDKGFYHCFGCSAHGDAIRFLTENKGLPFMDAVKELAGAAGMEVPAADPRAAQKAERQTGLAAANEAAAKWFAEELKGIGGAEARAYLKKRGINDALAAAFGMGFAPDARGKLKGALASFGNETLIEAGLLISVEDKEPYDRFRGRLMIPIRDQRGRTIAFGGRILGSGEPPSTGSAQAKYLNSPDTPLFDKGRTLFNVDRAGPASRKANRLIVVEGYMDVIALAKAGVDEVVAPNGTAVTEAQLERMWRLAEVPILCLDGDTAGMKAAVRAALRALPMVAPGRSLAFVTLPDGKDPDDLIKTGGREAFEAALTGARPLVDLLWQAELDAASLATPEGRAGLRQRLTDHARTIGDANVRDLYLNEFRRRFDELYAAPPRQQQGDRPQFRRGMLPARVHRPNSADAKAIGQGGIDGALARAIVTGLVRHAPLIAEQAEAVAALPIADPMLRRVRDCLVNGTIEHGPLENHRVAHILAEAGLSQAAEALNAANGLAFSFLRGDADIIRARRDLVEAIEVMAARPAIDAALTEATQAFGTITDDHAFAEQQRLTRERAATEQRLMALLQPDRDAEH